MSGKLCDCGHYEREHERIDLAGWTGAHCTAGTRLPSRTSRAMR
jgi:hypothetical protein